MKEEKYAEAQKNLVRHGSAVPLKKRKYRMNDDRLLKFQGLMNSLEHRKKTMFPHGYLKYLRAVGQSARGIFDQ